MKKVYQITCSIVIYKNDEKVLKKAIQSFLNTNLSVKLFLVDNSPSSNEFYKNLDNRIEYIFNNKNLGFGKAHNIAMKKAIDENSQYHLVLNPDVYFESGVLDKIYNFMEENRDVGQLMPKVLYPDGSVQYLCKLLPTPFDLFLRRFLGSSKLIEKRNEIYELRFSGYKRLMNIPYLSGCFMFFRVDTLKKIGLFDEKIFMYIEDADITRRIHQRFKTIFFPETQIYHHYAKGSYKSMRLMFYNLHGAIIYFNKWGWFWDNKRKKINQKVLISISKKNDD